jgi:hypothetical protein
MARRQVEEVRCDRCEKVDIRPVEETKLKEGPELEASFQGKKVRYDDLCQRCRDAVKNYFNSMTKQTDEEKAKAAADAPVEKTEDEGAKDQPKEKTFLGFGRSKELPSAVLDGGLL